MLEKIDLEKTLAKAEYKRRMPWLQERLLDLQTACWKGAVPSIILFEGWDAAGKGTTINVLTQRLEPRGFRLHAVQAPRTYETHLPWLWRFWQKLPNYGEMAIFDRSWYGRLLVERVEKLTPKAEWRLAFQDIVDLERALADDGCVLFKFFLHIGKKEQKRRFKALESDPMTAWHVQPEDWVHHRRYDEYFLAAEEMFARTETESAPWTIVEATDWRWSRVRVFDAIIRGLEDALGRRGLQLPPPPHAVPEEPSPPEDQEAAKPKSKPARTAKRGK